MLFLLPNIIGSQTFTKAFYNGVFYPETTSGAFLSSTKHVISSAAGGNVSFISSDFDASNANSIYGSGNVVQPKSLTSLYIIKT